MQLKLKSDKRTKGLKNAKINDFFNKIFVIGNTNAIKQIRKLVKQLRLGHLTSLLILPFATDVEFTKLTFAKKDEN